MAVTFKDFLDAIERIVAGVEKKSRVLSKAEPDRPACAWFRFSDHVRELARISPAEMG
jgi:hypothetical protein